MTWGSYLRHGRFLHIAMPILAALIWMVAVGSSAAQQATSDPYRLGATDQIAVRIVAWDSSRLAFVQFEELGGTYSINQDGTVMLPLVGGIEAAGQTPEQLAESISAAVHLKVGLSQSPSTTVEVVKYRPIYVLGDVARPGAYDFRPGLSAVQAVALAGGLFRLGSETGGELAAAIRTSGNFREIGMDRVRMQLRAARLKAEADQLEAFERPEGLHSPARAAAPPPTYDQEKILFDSRRDTLSSALEELEASRKLLETGIAARQEKMSGLQRQIDLVSESVGNIESLVEKGLARSQNLILLQRTLIDLEARALDMETGIFTTQQQVSELNRDEADLIAGRRLEVLRELQATEAEIDRLVTREDVSRRILRETDAGAVLAGESIDEPVSVVRYQILRDTGKGQESLTADRATPMQPLDVLEIILEDPTEEPIGSSEGG